jgi:hypothetical protein
MRTSTWRRVRRRWTSWPGIRLQAPQDCASRRHNPCRRATAWTGWEGWPVSCHPSLLGSRPSANGDGGRLSVMSRWLLIVLALAAVGFGCSGATTQLSTPTNPPAAVHDDVERDLVALRRKAIETAYPQFKDFENQESFAGQSVKSEVDNGDYYFAYVVHGSGVPIVQATCFRVDRVGRVFEVGVFPDPADSYAGYRDLNPRNCRGTR